MPQRADTFEPFLAGNGAGIKGEKCGSRLGNGGRAVLLLNFRSGCARGRNQSGPLYINTIVRYCQRAVQVPDRKKSHWLLRQFSSSEKSLHGITSRSRRQATAKRPGTSTRAAPFFGIPAVIPGNWGIAGVGGKGKVPLQGIFGSQILTRLRRENGNTEKNEDSTLKVLIRWNPRIVKNQ